MQLHHLVVAAVVGIGLAYGYEDPQAYNPFWLPSRSPFEVTVILWDRPPTPGLTWWAADGTQVGSASCKPGVYPELKCEAPPFDVGTYIVKFSSDTSKGVGGFKEVKPPVEVIEPPHVTSVSPAHGPEGSPTNITLSGTNIRGGPRTWCHFTYSPTGRTHGCEVTTAEIRAHQVTEGSASCLAPKWPGPLKISNATCSRDVKVQLTNEQKVWSQDPIVFHHDEDMGRHIQDFGRHIQDSEILV